MHANPHLRSLVFRAIDARSATAARPAEEASPTAEPDDRQLAAVTVLPTGTPLAELCPTVPVAFPIRDRGRLSLGTLLDGLGWRPAPGTKLELTVVVAADRPVLWLAGAAPPPPPVDCTCDRCPGDHKTPVERLLATGQALHRPATVDATGRVGLRDGHLAALEAADDEPLVVVALVELGLLGVATATDLALRGALTDVRVPDV